MLRFIVEFGKVAKRFPTFNTEKAHQGYLLPRLGKRTARYVASAALSVTIAVASGAPLVATALFGVGMLEFGWQAGRLARQNSERLIRLTIARPSMD